jgi:hypothetical protein
MPEEPELEDSSTIDEEEPQNDAAADRASRSKRGKQRGTPAGSAVPKAGGKASKILAGLGKAGEPLSPGEARRALYHGHIALAGILTSSAFDQVTAHRQGGELTERDFETAGDALADVSNHLFPQARLVLRAIAPLTLIGSEARIMTRIFEEVPPDAWWRRGRRQRSEAETYPYVMPSEERVS